jgi:proteic killer suppression protein
VILDFADAATEDLFHGNPSKEARRRLPRKLWRVARWKLDRLNAATDLRDLASPPGNRNEPMKGALQGLHSIRINAQYRIVFRFVRGDASFVQIVDYH